MKNSNRGFTLTEIIIVMAIVGILVAIAAPPVSQYLTNARYREANQAIFGSLLDARQRAVSLNREVQFILALDAGAANKNNTYVLQYSNGAPVSEMRTLPDGVEIRANDACSKTSGSVSINFNPDGTAGSSTGLYICIMDDTTRKYRSGVNNTATGRVVSQIWRGSSWK